MKQTDQELQESDPELIRYHRYHEIRYHDNRFAEQPPRLTSLEERLQYFSSWFRAKRAVALCLCYINRLRKCVRKKIQPSGETKLEVSILEGAEHEIICSVQVGAFKEEIVTLNKLKLEASEPGSRSFAQQWRASMKVQSSLYKLVPFMDSSGILRVGGRLRRANLSNKKHPIILPRRSHVTKMIIEHYHESTKNQGKVITLNEVRFNIV